MALGRRWRIGAAVVIPAVVILLAAPSVAVVSYLLAAVPIRAPLCSDSSQQIEKARALVQRGLDEAMVEHTTRLFRVWLSAGAEGRERAAEGVRTEVRGFFFAQKAIESWAIPPCKAGR